MQLAFDEPWCGGTISVDIRDRTSLWKDQAMTKRASREGLSRFVAWHPKLLASKRFWVIQASIALIFLTHQLLESYSHSGVSSAVLLLFLLSAYLIPITIAAYSFGLSGSMATAAWVTLLVIVDLMLDHAPNTILSWAHVVQMVSIDIVALILGHSFDIVHAQAQGRLFEAFHDSLTGLGNRALFSQVVRDSLDGRLAGPTGEESVSAALLLLDLEDFKLINDTFGHQVGDEILRQVASRVQSAACEAESCFRFGGDEFAVFLLDLQDKEAALEVAQRMQHFMGKPFVVNVLASDGEARREVVHIKASIGIAFAAQGPEVSETLVNDADMAMHAAKAEGVEVLEWSSTLRSDFAARAVLREDLARAVDNGEFVLFYQPVVGLQSGTVVGVEALIRWEHPTRGLVGPVEFIETLEETGLIVPVGRWVLHEACRQLGEWLDIEPDGPPLTMGVNVSGIQLRDPEFVKDLEELLVKSELCATNLILEITESVALSQESSVLLSLLDRGLHVAIDDFGTGYSSMSSLRKIPADILKIDKAFVDDVSSDQVALAIVRAISDLARSVGMETVAEGVETAEQLRRLVDLGCDSVQGYLMAKPERPEDISRFFGTKLPSWENWLEAETPLRRLV